MPRNLTVETFVRIESRILISIAFFLVGGYHIWSFTDVERKSVGLEPIINTYQLPIHSGLMSLSDAKTVISSAKWTKRIWFEDLYMSLIYKRKSAGINTEPCGPPNILFDIEELPFLIETYCFLLVKCDSNQYCLTPLTPLCRSLLINMLWLTVSNAFEKSRYTAMVLCLLSNDE